MFAIFKDIPDENAYKIFTLAHLPIYFLVLWIMAQGGAKAKFILYCMTDIFLISHAVIYHLFKNNRFTSGLSKILIYSMAVLAVIHLLLFYL